MFANLNLQVQYIQHQSSECLIYTFFLSVYCDYGNQTIRCGKGWGKLDLVATSLLAVIHVEYQLST